MKNRAAWIAGALGAAGVAYRALRRRPKPATDPRADELRRKLDDSKQLVEEREQFESGETPVDEVELAAERPVRESEPVEGKLARSDREVPPADSLPEKRAAVHERGHEAARQMRGPKNSFQKNEP